MDIARTFYYALSRAMFTDNYCWICQKHPSNHKEGCAFVEYNELLIEERIRETEEPLGDGEPDFTLDDLEWKEEYE